MGKTSTDSSKPTMAKLSVGDEEMKREKRRAANRRSALKSRYRETVMLEELQRNTQELSVQNSSLRQENETLKSLSATIRRVQSEAQQAAQIKSLLMLAGANTNMSQQASPLPGMSYEQLLNVISAVSNSQQQQGPPPTQTAALAQHLQLTSDQRRNFM